MLPLIPSPRSLSLSGCEQLRDDKQQPLIWGVPKMGIGFLKWEYPKNHPKLSSKIRPIWNWNNHGDLGIHHFKKPIFIKQFRGVIRFYAIYVHQREHLLLLHIMCTTLPLTHMSELLKARLSESYQSLTIWIIWSTSGLSSEEDWQK